VAQTRETVADIKCVSGGVVDEVAANSRAGHQQATIVAVSARTLRHQRGDGIDIGLVDERPSYGS
jgi:hypothetical protein